MYIKIYMMGTILVVSYYSVLHIDTHKELINFKYHKQVKIYTGSVSGKLITK
jgi:hypothetical protein